MRFLTFALLCVPVLAQADALDDLRARLDAAHSASPVKARIERHSLRKVSEDDEARTFGERRGSLTVALDSKGLKLQWPLQQIVAARREAELRAKDDAAAAPNLDSLSLLSAREAADLLDHAPVLSLLLNDAALLEERDDRWQERPARLLLLRAPEPPMDAETRKQLKTHEGTLKIWLDPTGAPLALERLDQFKGSKFFVSFTADNRDTREFALVKGRLVVTRAETSNGSTVLGETNSFETVTTVVLENSRP